MTSFFSRNKTFLDNFIMYNRSFVLLFFSLCSSKLLVREKEKKKRANVSKVHQC